MARKPDPGKLHRCTSAWYRATTCSVMPPALGALENSCRRHVAPCPPGVPYYEQQMTALTTESTDRYRDGLVRAPAAV